MTGTAYRLDEYVDIGRVPDRPPTPPEPDITDADLDALRAQWTEEVKALAEDADWWAERSMMDATFSRCAFAVLGLHAQGQHGAAAAAVDIAIRREVERLEREYFS